MPDTICVALDAMGGDNAPGEVVRGALLALEDARLRILLVGNEPVLRDLLGQQQGGRLEIVHASQVIETEEPPTAAIRHKRDSSLMVGLGLLKAGRAQAFVSAGNTGALLAGATVTLGRLAGIERPALATLIPTEAQPFLLVDSGANVDCKPPYLLQFAQMGAVYMEHALGRPNPKVGLLNIGTESEKGNDLAKEAHRLLAASRLNFVGNVEARGISAGAADVLVCDGFVGNVVLKYTEGLAKSLMGMIKTELTAGPVTALGALLAGGAFKRLKKRFDYTEVGGAPFLGLQALVVKAHGSSDARAVRGAARQCVAFVDSNAQAHMKILTETGVNQHGI
jgi:glycerol-3-phosphate acyltransferase PlsX